MQWKEVFLEAALLLRLLSFCLEVTWYIFPEFSQVYAFTFRNALSVTSGIIHTMYFVTCFISAKYIGLFSKNCSYLIYLIAYWETRMALASCLSFSNQLSYSYPALLYTRYTKTFVNISKRIGESKATHSLHLGKLHVTGVVPMNTLAHNAERSIYILDNIVYANFLQLFIKYNLFFYFPFFHSNYCHLISFTDFF